MSKKEEILIVKASGLKVAFSENKLRKSLYRSGAHEDQVDIIIDEIVDSLSEGMSTKEIYKKAFRLLKNTSGPLAARYKLKQAILELGPTGFPFERFISELLKYRGYNTEVGKIVQGHCVQHEIDVIAEKDNHHFMIECKYHNQQGFVSNVKIPLYIQSRFLDVEKKWKSLEGHSEKFHQGWVITNTRFSADAEKYGVCIGMQLVSWDFPLNNGLKDWIDQSGLYPITSLTTLRLIDKQKLLDLNYVLCRSIDHNPNILKEIGLEKDRIPKVLDECKALCESIINHIHQ